MNRIVFLAALALTSTAAAQDGLLKLDVLGDFGTQPEPTVTTTLAPVSGTAAELQAGDEVELAITLELPPGSYTYAQTSPKGGPVEFTLNNSPGLTPVSERFVPDRAPKREFEPLFKGDVEKFTDRVTWTRRFRLTENAQPSEVSVQGALNYQFCDANSCKIRDVEFIATLPGESGSPGQFTLTTPAGGTSQPVMVTVSLLPENAQPGDTVTLSVHMAMKEGWHTYSLTQPPGNAAKTTVIQVDPRNLKPVGENFEADRPFETKTIELGKKTAMHEYYEGDVTWSRKYVVEPAAAESGYGVSGKLDSQACKAACVTVDVPFELGTAAKPEQVASREQPTPTPPTPSEPSRSLEPGEQQNVWQAFLGADEAAGDEVATVEASDPRAKGFLWFVGWAALSGALSLLTPCVFPMIPITVSFFLKQAEKAHHKPATLAIIYSGAIVLTFTVLGMLIAMLVGGAALTQLANSLVLNIVLAVVLVFFGISMLGFFEIAMPSWLLTWSSNKESKGGIVGTLFMALTFTLVSFTCTFPVAGTVLVWASAGEFFWPIVGMLTFSIVFAAPFFLLALFPAFLKKLPKSGGWMTNVKVTLGLLEIGAALKFLSVAELAWHRPATILTFDTVLVLWFAIAVVTALYILGLIRFPHDAEGRFFTLPRVLLAIPFAVMAWRLVYVVSNPESPQNWLDRQIAAFATPVLDVSESDVLGLVEVDHGLPYGLELERAVVYAQQVGKPLFLDFTGVNCINCREMEQRMGQPANRERLEQFVRVKLYTDLMPAAAEADESGQTRSEELLTLNRKVQSRWFGNNALPSYAVVTPQGEKLGQLIGMESHEGQFTEFLDQGLAKWNAQQSTAATVPATATVQR